MSLLLLYLIIVGADFHFVLSTDLAHSGSRRTIEGKKKQQHYMYNLTEKTYVAIWRASPYETRDYMYCSSRQQANAHFDFLICIYRELDPSHTDTLIMAQSSF